MTTTRGRIRVESSYKRVRVYLGGHVVVDSNHPLLVWESPRYPTYYFPADDVCRDLLSPDGETTYSPSLGTAQKFTVQAGPRRAPGAAIHYTEPLVDELREHFRFEWEAMDSWFEEDEEVCVHVRDPYARIDVLPSSRHVRVEVDGVTIAESSAPRLLFETGLPLRCYLPKTHVRMDLLEPTATVTRCPYKGVAEYWSIRVGDQLYQDLAWSYRTPLPESQKIAGLIAFSKADIYVEGVLQDQPSRRPPTGVAAPSRVEAPVGTAAARPTATTPVGTWSATVALGEKTIDVRLAFQQDGSVQLATPVSAGEGNWTRTGENCFAYKIKEIFTRESGLSGWVKINQDAVQTGSTFSSAGNSTIYDAEGNQLASVWAEMSATRSTQHGGRTRAAMPDSISGM